MKTIELGRLVGCAQIPLTLRYRVIKHVGYYILYVSVKPVLGVEYEIVETVRGEEKEYKSLDAVLSDIIKIENPESDDIVIKIQICENKNGQ